MAMMMENVSGQVSMELVNAHLFLHHLKTVIEWRLIERTRGEFETGEEQRLELFLEAVKRAEVALQEQDYQTAADLLRSFATQKISRWQLARRRFREAWDAVWGYAQPTYAHSEVSGDRVPAAATEAIRRIDLYLMVRHGE